MRSTGARAVLALTVTTTLGLASCGSDDGATSGSPTAPAIDAPVIVKASGREPDLSASELAALARDLDQAGDGTDLTLADVADQQAFSQVVAVFADRFPETYFGSGVPGAADDAYWVLVTDDPSRAQLAALAGTPVDVEVRSGAVASETEFEAATHRLWRALSTGLPAEDGLMVWPEADGSSIDVHFDEQLFAAEDVRAIADRALGDAIPVSLVPGGPILTSW